MINITRKNVLYLLAGLAALLPFQNCGGGFNSVNSSSSSPSDFLSEGYAQRFDAAKAVIQQNCASCHYPGASGGNLLFDSESEYINARLITPGSVGSSKLITRLRNYPAAIDGRNMPPSGPISDSDYRALTAWVESMPLPNTNDLFLCEANEAPATLDARRLSKTEMLNTLRRVLSRPYGTTEAEQILTGSASTFLSRIPNDNRSPFSQSDRSFESGHADAYFDLAEELANAMTSGNRYSRLVTTYVNYSRGSCANLDVNALSNACRDAFINNFLLRLWGRPVSSVTGALTAYQSEFSTTLTSLQAVNNFLFRALISPQFLLHIYNDVTPVDGEPAQLSSFALARRLSYHFQLSGLDEYTISLASSSNLQVDANYSIALNHLSQSPGPMLESFVDDWLKLYRISSIPVPNSPKWTRVAAGITFDSNLRTAMRRELLDFVTYIYSSGRPVQEILTSNVALARHSGLMQIYGQTTPAPANFTESSAVRLPASERAGIATRAGYLYNAGDSERPIVRGLHVMQDLLCTEVRGQVPPEAATTPIPTGILTTRQKYDQVTSGSSCIGCHSQINPLGNAFSNYNAFGGFQMSEPIFDGGVYRQDLPVDSRVNLQTTAQVNVDVNNGVDFSRWMATSEQFRGCFTKKYHTFTQRLNAMPTSTSSCDMRRMSEVIRNNGSLADFMRAPVVDGRFRRRAIVP